MYLLYSISPCILLPKSKLCVSLCTFHYDFSSDALALDFVFKPCIWQRTSCSRNLFVNLRNEKVKNWLDLYGWKRLPSLYYKLLHIIA